MKTPSTRLLIRPPSLLALISAGLLASTACAPAEQDPAPGPLGIVTSALTTVVASERGASATTGADLCHPSYPSPQCLARPFDNSGNVASVAGGFARPAVAKDCLPGNPAIHDASFVNDGLYGNGSSWIANSANSWIKIDLGRPTAISGLRFGRDRAGGFDDRDPGRFIVSVALSDDVYAMGNDSNDAAEYTPIVDSAQSGFSGFIAGSETIQARFPQVLARYVKLQVSNAATAIDEVEISTGISLEGHAASFTGADVCRGGFAAPQCLARPADTRASAASLEGGLARPAVAKDVIAGFPAIHDASFVNDGLYGNGSSWITPTANSWIKIDLGQPTEIDGVRFGRDRTGHHDDRDPGQFIVSVAMADDVYAMGHESNDALEYTPVFDSSQTGFSGGIAGAQTVRATFPRVTARYVKLQVSNPGAAIDELEVSTPAVQTGNTVYGYWSSSGGQNPTSTGNRVLLAEYEGPAGPVTFHLSSSADGFLYVLDMGGTVIASDDNSGGGHEARITAHLAPGTYQVVAATQAPGLSGDFMLISDKARLRYPQRLEVLPASRFTWVYDDGGTGSDNDVSVWRPDLSQYPGYYSLGDVASPFYGAPSGTFVVRGDGDLLAPPIDYNWVWSDWGSGGTHDASVWDPVPPAGYTCLGTVVALGYGKPSTHLIRCIKSAYVLPANASWVWHDAGSGADYDVSFWQADAQSHRGLQISTFSAMPFYGSPGRAYWTLNKSATANPELSGGPVDATVARRFAPRVWLAAGEYYFPSSVEFFLPNVHEEVHGGTQYLVTNQPLGCDSCTDPQFLDGQNPAQTPVPVYVQIVPRTQGGNPSNVTDAIYWMFYPYNNGKRVCIGWMSPWGCVGGYSTFGNHVGDWEHVTLRFIDGRPAQVFLSQHSNGQLLNYGDKSLFLLDWRPEIFSALGSHGAYPDARRHTYQDLPNGDDLNDDTSYGTAWDTWNATVVFGSQPLGSYTGSLSWLNFPGRWGNPASGCGVIESVSGECVLNPGPGSLIPRAVSNPEYWTLD